MTDYDNTNSGGLWPNREKNTPKHPDMTGNAHIKCPACGEVSKHRVAAWDKTSKAGAPWTSLAFRLPAEDAPTPAPRQEDRNDLNDDIPF